MGGGFNSGGMWSCSITYVSIQQALISAHPPTSSDQIPYPCWPKTLSLQSLCSSWSLSLPLNLPSFLQKSSAHLGSAPWCFSWYNCPVTVYKPVCVSGRKRSSDVCWMTKRLYSEFPIRTYYISKQLPPTLLTPLSKYLGFNAKVSNPKMSFKIYLFRILVICNCNFYRYWRNRFLQITAAES